MNYGDHSLFTFPNSQWIDHNRQFPEGSNSRNYEKLDFLDCIIYLALNSTIN